MQRLTPIKRKPNQEQTAIDEIRTSGASVIQKHWKILLDARKLKNSVKTYRSLEDGSALQYAKNKSTEQVSKYMKQTNVKSAFTACYTGIMNHVVRACGISNSRLPKPNYDKMMAAYLVAFHPKQVFSCITFVETELSNSGMEFVLAFESIIEHIESYPSRIPKKIAIRFPVLAFRYITHFDKWKKIDEQRQGIQIRYALFLNNTRRSMNVIEDSDIVAFSGEPLKNAKHLEARLKMISGQAALDQFNTDMEDNVFEKELNSDDEITAIGNQFQSTTSMGQEDLAHQAFVNPDFSLTDDIMQSQNHETETATMRLLHRSFWYCMVEYLSIEVPYYDPILNELKEIRDLLITDSMSPEHQHQIHETIDLEFINCQLQSGTFGWSECEGLVRATHSIMQGHQTPTLIEKFKPAMARVFLKLEAAKMDFNLQPKALVSAIACLKHQVHEILLERNNNRMKRISPVVRVHGVSYELIKFQEKLESGALTLNRTTDWVKSTIATTVDTVGLKQGTATAYMHVLTKGVSVLLLNSVPITKANIPETFILDARQFWLIQQEIKKIITNVAILSLATHCLERKLTLMEEQTFAQVLQFMKTDKCFIFDIKKTTSRFSEIMSTCEWDPNTRSKILSKIKDGDTKTNQVRTIIERRVAQLLGGFMQGSQVPEISWFPLKEFVPQIRSAAQTVMGLVRLNSCVHVQTYNQIIAKAVSELD